MIKTMKIVGNFVRYFKGNLIQNSNTKKIKSLKDRSNLQVY